MKPTDVIRATQDEVAINPVEMFAYWFNNSPTVEGELARGLHLPCGNPQLDGAAAQLNWKYRTVIHRDTVEKPYWVPSPVSLIYIAANAQKREELNGSSIRKGIAYGWGPTIDEKTKAFRLNEQGQIAKSCTIRIRFLIHELTQVGYLEPFLLTGRGWITDSFLETCYATYRLTRALAMLRRQEQNVALPFFYSVAVPINAATRPIPAGETFVYPMVPDMPIQLTDEFVRKQETSPDVIRFIQATLLYPTIEWSKHESAAIIHGAQRRPIAEEGVIITEVGEDDPSGVEEQSTQRGPVLLNLEQEAEALSLLFERDVEQEKNRLATVKELYRQLYPRFSQGQYWWESILDRVFPGRWPEVGQIREEELTEPDLDQLERVYKRTHAKLMTQQEEIRLEEEQ